MQRWKNGSLRLSALSSSPFLRHNAVFLFGSLSVAALNYLFYPVLSRLMDPADFGEVQTLTSLFTQAAIFLTILTYVTINVTVNVKDPIERNKTLMALERLAMAAGYGLLLVALLSVSWLREFLHFSGNLPFIALIFAVGLSIPLAFRMAYLRGRKQFLRASITDGVSSAGKLILAPILVLLGGKSLGAISALALSQVLSLAVGMYWAREAGLRLAGGSWRSMHFELVKPQLRHALALLIGSGGVTVLQTLDIVAIKHYFTPEQAGMYAGITTIASIIFFVMAPVVGVMVTLIGESKPHPLNQKRLYGTLALMSVLGGGALLFMSLFPSFTVALLVGSKYAAYANLLPRIGVAMLILGLANALMMYHIALKKYRYAMVSVVVFVLTFLLLMVNHGTIVDVINDLIAGSSTLFLITVLQNLKFNQTNHSPRRG
jgi:O-antigen/teichoic acid export membrane protein